MGGARRNVSSQSAIFFRPPADSRRQRLLNVIDTTSGLRQNQQKTALVVNCTDNESKNLTECVVLGVSFALAKAPKERQQQRCVTFYS